MRMENTGCERYLGVDGCRVPNGCQFVCVCTEDVCLLHDVCTSWECIRLHVDNGRQHFSQSLGKWAPRPFCNVRMCMYECSLLFTVKEKTWNEFDCQNQLVHGLSADNLMYFLGYLHKRCPYTSRSKKKYKNTEP